MKNDDINKFIIMQTYGSGGGVGGGSSGGYQKPGGYTSTTFQSIPYQSSYNQKGFTFIIIIIIIVF
jgi:hypothetical protein